MKKEFFNKCIIFNNAMHVNILQSAYAQLDNTWKYYRLTSPYNRLYFVLGGQAYLKNEYATISLTPGNVYLIPKNTVYDYICDEYLEKVFFHFTCTVFDIHEVFDGLDYVISFKYDYEAINEILLLLRQNELSSFVKIRSIIENVISKAIYMGNNKLVTNLDLDLYCKYNHIFKYINLNILSTLKICDIENEFGYALNSLSRKIKKDLGINLKKYIDMTLCNKSKNLLLTSSCSIKQISEQLGFCDQYYFSRFFKKHMNTSPQNYRKNNKV